MNWKESNIQAIATKRIFYFDNEVSSICLRICKQLNIEVFPSYDGEWFYKYNKETETDTWDKLKLTEYQRVNCGILIFDNEILDKFNKTPSQILFVFDDDQFQGIVHFTDYSKKIVYHDLYINFFEFERKLKELLIIKDFSAESFIKYFKYNAEKDPMHKNYYNKVKDKLVKEKVNYPLDTLYLKDLLEFCDSDFHKNNNTEKPLIISDSKKKAINELRNMVMHSRDNTGISSTRLHDFSKFKSDFFDSVQIF